MTFRRTIVPWWPRISFTTSLSFMSMHVDDRAVVALADADDAIVGLQAAVLRGRAAGDDLLDDRVAVGAFSAAPMPSRFSRIWISKFSSVSARHVGRVRIEGRGQGGQIHFQQFVVIGLLHPLGELW